MQLPILPPRIDWRDFFCGFVMGLAICGGCWVLGFAFGYALWPLLPR